MDIQRFYVITSTADRNHKLYQLLTRKGFKFSNNTDIGEFLFMHVNLDDKFVICGLYRVDLDDFVKTYIQELSLSQAINLINEYPDVSDDKNVNKEDLHSFKLRLLAYCQRKQEKAKANERVAEKNVEIEENSFVDSPKYIGFDLGYQKGILTAFEMIEDFVCKE